MQTTMMQFMRLQTMMKKAMRMQAMRFAMLMSGATLLAERAHKCSDCLAPPSTCSLSCAMPKKLVQRESPLSP